MVKQTSLFSPDSQTIDLPDGRCVLIPEFIDFDSGQALFKRVLSEVAWTQDRITLYGKTHLAPRLSYWMADADLSYRYSNMTLHPKPWIGFIKELTEHVSAIANADFNSVLINQYRDGNDSNGWHADNEPELGPDPVVASLSLGAQRDFRLRHNASRKTLTLPLTHGSLLIMREGMQTHWQHTVPKRAQAESRINLTFRTVYR